jgi:glutathione synthase/RimK-type ligase-like ATP-grasp enzyme
MALAGQAGRGLDVLMLGGVTLTQINTMALPPVSTVLNNLGNAEIMEQAGHATLIEALARRLAVRLLNPPAAVLKTSRAGNFAKFGGKREFIFPKTVRFSPSGTDGRHDARTVLAQFPLPVIVRSVVGHEGNRVFLCRSQDELKAALAKFRGADCYAIAFHDCQIREGLWRKFRVLCIGGEVIPASVHYSDEWNVHLHRSRDITTALPDAETVKSAFRKDPAATIGAANWDIILKVCAAVDLDIFGIDFGFDRDGRLVLYEINANMRANPQIFREPLERLLWRKP